MITDDASVMEYFADYVEDNWGDFEYVVYAEKSGILPWKGSEKLSQHMVIIQETPYVFQCTRSHAPGEINNLWLIRYTSVSVIYSTSYEKNSLIANQYVAIFTMH